ncbi:YbhB/YbcL family Raf kinase inhibitor-like protein [Azohydromonas caseinilytica]|uniref:YbhB/YbcL family Raf kinase inhibitor-like protein n=1 Tax=Azohydromonas caseinilytica TaxID=2728836 RepID=A0A848FHE7_9BURK|nr:YbhB/YbcL family Raf kinase inhibitor-like protein [Azohydromonas caseinilytica]NML18682.1 YbhB/YbcL family Raf kinase inhibitor-like protein [Azohydromonas caseinilytica]
MLEKLPDLVGAALRGQRAGLDQTAFVRVRLPVGQGAIQVTSLAFADHAPLPPRFTADGEGHSPPLQWSGVPANAASLLLLVEDADSPTPHPLVHAIAYDIPPQEVYLPEGALNGEEDASLQLGRNSYLRTAWIPPDPPPAHGVHRYAFQLFALGPGVAWSGTPGREAVLQALEQHAIASGCLIGTYERHDTSVRDDAGATAPVRSDLGAP